MRLGAIAALYAVLAGCTPPMRRVAAPERPEAKAPDAVATGVVELASGDGVFCARSAQGRVVCWSGAGAIDLDKPREIAANGAARVLVVDGRAWTQSGSAWRSVELARHFVDAPVAPPGAATEGVFLGDGIACVQQDGGTSCVLDAKWNRTSPWRLPRAAGALVLRVEGGVPWLCAHLSDRNVECWSAEQKSLVLARGVRRLGEGERLCVALEDGRVECARDDTSFEKGVHWDTIGTYASVRELSVGAELGCVQVAASHVECWSWQPSYEDRADAGSVYRGELRANPERVVGLGGVAKLSVGSRHACALDERGEISCWGQVQPAPARGPELERMPFTRATEVAVGARHACVIQNHGVWCWGDDSAGQLGRPANPRNLKGPALVADVATAVELALGDRHTCVRNLRGRVDCWGDASLGRLGRARDKSPWSTEVTGISAARRLGAGTDFTCALDDTSVKCWGNLDLGQGTERATPLGELAGASDLGVDGRTVCGLIAGKVVCARLGKNRQLATPIARDAVELSGNCARMSAGNVRCFAWRRTEHHDGVREELHAAEVPDLGGVTRIWAGAGGVCARSARGTRCFEFSRGELSVESETRFARTGTLLAAAEAFGDPTSIAASAQQVCVVRESGHVHCASKHASGSAQAWTPRTVRWPD